MPCFCAKLPHELDSSDFEDEGVDAMPLTDWLALWLGGFGDEAVDQAESHALVRARKMIGLRQSEHTLRAVEHLLSPEQKLTIWCEIFELHR